MSNTTSQQEFDKRKRLIELGIVKEKLTIARNAQQHNHQLALKELEVDKINVEHEIESINFELAQLESENITEHALIDHVTSNQQPHETYRRDMLWQLRLMMSEKPSVFSSESVTSYMEHFDLRTGPASQVDYLQNQIKPINKKHLPESVRYFNAAAILPYIPTSDKNLQQQQLDHIQSFIGNRTFEHVIIFVQSETKHQTAEALAKLSRPDRYTVVKHPTEPKLVTVLEFCKEQIMSQDGEESLFVLAAPLYHPDLSIEIVKQFDLTNRLIVIGHDKNKYWENGVVVFDNTLLSKKIDKKIKFFDETGLEQFVSDMKSQHVECLGLTPGDHLKCKKSLADKNSSLSINRPDSRNINHPDPSKIKLDNFVNGDTCEWSPGLAYYEDRLSGEPGKFFERDAGRLFYTHTNEMCVFYLCCEKEIDNGQLIRSIAKFFELTPSQKYSFDLHIVTDGCNDTPGLTNKIKNLASRSGVRCVGDIQVSIVNIPENDNIFTYDIAALKSSGYVPKMGASHGVNQLFYDGVKHMYTNYKQYSKYLMLETDCQPLCRFWFDRVLLCCEDILQDYVVAGSKHKGSSNMHRNTNYADHLNGVAVYNNTPGLLKLLEGGQQYIERHVSKNPDSPIMNFDVGNYLWAKQNSFTEHMVDLVCISNYSSKENKDITVRNVLKRHPETVILHKKFGVGD
jgi:hypothetical protein